MFANEFFVAEAKAGQAAVMMLNAIVPSDFRRRSNPATRVTDGSPLNTAWSNGAGLVTALDKIETDARHRGALWSRTHLRCSTAGTRSC